MTAQKIPLAVLVGPTAVGKTEAAIECAKALGAEIISADSMQVYRGMDIGTAKPTDEERQGVPHHLMDCADPDVEFNVARYQEMANKAIQDIHGRGRLPLLTGGTGLYIHSILYPMNFTDAGDDPALRKQLQAWCDQEGREALHQRLNTVDPETAARLHPNDVRRVIRALEIFYLTGNKMSEYRQDLKGIETACNPMIMGLTIKREKLYRRIDQRADQMLAQGLVEEVEGLLAKGYHKDLVSMQGLGYKEVIPVLEDARTLEEAAEILKRDTRRYAKRQWTWFRRDPRVHWIDWDDFNSKDDGIRWIISHFKQNISFKE